MFSSIRMVEIEIHSFCNRKCSWCPNIKIKRDVFIELPEKLYIEVLNELKNLNFKGTISYSRYNEPMSKIELLKERLEQAKEILPHVKKVCNTNGDYLHHGALRNLSIDELTVMDYDCIGLRNCLEKLRNIKAHIINVKYPYIRAWYDDIEILFFVDWPKHALLTDRGGYFRYDINNKGIKMNLTNKQIRRIPCYEPSYFIGIDYTGDVTPCCQIRGDNPDQHSYILGNINDNSLERIFSSPKAKSFRSLLLSRSYENYPLTCKRCSKHPGRYTRNNPGINY